MKTMFCKIIVLGFYYLGDVFSKIDSELAANLYQRCMNISVEWDEKINFYWWKSVEKQ